MNIKRGEFDFAFKRGDDEFIETCGHDISIEDGTLVLVAYNEGGQACTHTDLDELIDYVLRRYSGRFGSLRKHLLEVQRNVEVLNNGLSALRQEIHDERSESFMANQKVDALAERLGYEVVADLNGGEATVNKI